MLNRIIFILYFSSCYDDSIELEDSLLASSIPGIGPVKDILPMLRTSKCFNSCRANSFKREDFEISYNTIDAFFSKSFYLMVQWAYNQVTRWNCLNLRIFNSLFRRPETSGMQPCTIRYTITYTQRWRWLKTTNSSTSILSALKSIN